MRAVFGHALLVAALAIVPCIARVLIDFMDTPPAHGQLLLSGYTYAAGQGPCWQVDDLATTPTQRYMLPVGGRMLSLQPLAVRHCIGTYDLAMQKHVPCPYRRQVKPPYRNCYPCFQAIGFHPAFYHVPQEQLSPRQQVYNQAPHCTYLAYFGPGVVKVGITLQKRVLKRWLEQGARAAVVLQVAEDAYQARTIEAQVSETLRLPERITVAKKKLLLNVPYCFEEAALVLVERQQAIMQALSLQKVTYAAQDLQGHYFPTALPYPLVDADQKQQPISGRVLSMVGDLVVYEAGGGFWISTLKQYLGSAYVRLEAVPVATQTSFSFA